MSKKKSKIILNFEILWGLARVKLAYGINLYLICLIPLNKMFLFRKGSSCIGEYDIIIINQKINEAKKTKSILYFN